MKAPVLTINPRRVKTPTSLLVTAAGQVMQAYKDIHGDEVARQVEEAAPLPPPLLQWLLPGGNWSGPELSACSSPAAVPSAAERVVCRGLAAVALMMARRIVEGLDGSEDLRLSQELLDPRAISGVRRHNFAEGGARACERHGGRGPGEVCLHDKKLFFCLSDGSVPRVLSPTCSREDGLNRIACGQGGRLCGGVSYLLVMFGVDAAELMGQLMGGRSRGRKGDEEEMRKGIQEMRASIEDHVKHAYLTILRREADPGGLASYTDHLLVGDMDVEGLEQLLKDSDEFKTMKKRSSEQSVREQLIHSLSDMIQHSRCLDEMPRLLTSQSSSSTVGRCPDSKGYPLWMYKRLLVVFVKEATSHEVIGLSNRTITTTLDAIRLVDNSYKEILGRWAGREDLRTNVGRILHDKLSISTLQDSLRRSSERKSLEVAGRKTVDHSKSKAMLKRVIQQFCPSQLNEQEERNRPLRALQEIWNQHSPYIFNKLPTSFSWKGGKNFFIPIAMYVYDRPNYLSSVLNALRRVRGIHDVLLIVSLDKPSQEIFDVLLSVDFCTLRIFFHPSTEPAIGGVGGRGSDGVLVIKEHWIFLLRAVFSMLPELSDYKRDVLLLEEDHVPTPDALLTLQALLKIRDRCDGCWGVYLKFGCEREEKEEDERKACRVKWFVNTGLAFNRSVFHSILNSDFLDFRDGWDWSIYHLIQTRQLLPCQPSCTPHMVAPAVSRISNIGRSGVTVREDDAKLLQQLNYRTVSMDLLDKGFNASSIALSPYFGHAGPPDEPLYFGMDEKHLG